MRFVADVHLHSRHARATSRDLNPENLHKWSALKGITVVGTGDFTHPVWLEELEEKLEPAEEGLYQLKAPWRAPVEAELPPSCRGEVRFVLSVEISSIYKKNGRTRKIHNVVILPGFEQVEALNRRLGAIGNLKADGRPILGLDSRDLLEICLEVYSEVLFIPAHIWTPHFAVLGSESGFDSLEECFEELLPHIPAVETGLSSDPPMNGRLSELDRFAIVSNSDAHSPQKLAREGTCFDTERSYPALLAALRSRDPLRFTGTLEFYPEEGKYHYDGHRKCQVRWKPAQTLAAGGVCPECGQSLTVGVLHRVERLADRPEGSEPAKRQSFEYLIPLSEVIGSSLGVGPSTKKAQAVYHQLLTALGTELHILRAVPVEQIARCGEGLVAEGVRRMRAGQVQIAAGYDGEYGTIQLFTDQERERLKGQGLLFAMSASPARQKEREERIGPKERAEAPSQRAAALSELDPVQQQAVEAGEGPVVVIAGPGSGKTRTLTHRIAHLIRRRAARPGQILALTFTRKAAGALRQRLAELLSGTESLEELVVGTFHQAALQLMKQAQPQIPLRAVVDEWEARSLLSRAIEENGAKLRPAVAQQAIALAKAAGQRPEAVDDEELGKVYRAYQQLLGQYRAWDYDDILLDFLDLLREEDQRRAALRARFPYVLVDEFQDLNAVQYELVNLLAGTGGGLFAIGDPDQAIYGFRGADPKYFSQLLADFPTARRFELETNYRCAAPIVQAAAAVISNNPGRQLLRLRPARQGGAPLRLLWVSGERAEGIAVVQQISRMVGGADMVQADQRQRGGPARSLADFAVLFRTHAQAEALEACFQHAGIPYRLCGQQRFLEAAPVRRALAFCRYLLWPDDLLRRQQALEVLGAADLEKAVARYCLLAAQERPAVLLRRWQEEYGAGEEADLTRLVQLAENAGSLEELLAVVAIGVGADYERQGPGATAEAVRLLTLHAAKGLEFGVVFLCGVEDGLLPLHEADLEEERRLFYVGLTRAREELVLVSARNRLRHGQRVEQQVSAFVREIPAELLVEERVELPRRARTEQLSLF